MYEKTTVKLISITIAFYVVEWEFCSKIVVLFLFYEFAIACGCNRNKVGS